MSQQPDKTVSRRSLATAAELRDDIDCVYFLMWPGWKEEMRSNRWHYAKRWSQIAPVVLVQPDLPPSDSGKAVSEPEPRIPNCRILRIETQDGGSPLMVLNQLEQIQSDLKAHGFRRPLLWLYNPKLAGLFCGLAAAARIVHSSENYFEYSPPPHELLEQLRLCLKVSDLVVAVSSGVAAGIAAHVPEAKITLVSNGCDYHAYATGSQDVELTALRQGYRKVAIYAGNINLRIDFDLLLSCVASFPDTLFVLVGPVKGSAGPNPLEPSDQAVWERLLQMPNCRHLGAVDPERLPDLYAAADIGIIPYRDLCVLRESGFPLKALEMLATRLPVVSTLMRPIVGLSDALVVVDNASDFRNAVRTLCRDALSQQARSDMDALCRANDYDEKFRQVIGALAETLRPDASTTTHIAPLVAELRRGLLLVEEGKRTLAAELESVQTVYYRHIADREKLVNEIERLRKVWHEQNHWYNEQTHSYNEQIQQLHTMHGEEIRERDLEIARLTMEIARLTGEIQYYRRFRTAARRIPGVGPLLRALRDH